MTHQASRKRKPAEDIYDNFTTQLRQEHTDGGFLARPSKQARLANDDGSAQRKVGASELLAKKSNLEPFRGMDAFTPMMNQMALFNPRPGPLDKPKSAISVRFDDDEERVFGWPVNDCMVYHVNAKLVRNNYRFTHQCLGQHELVFAFKEQKISPHPETSNDVKLCSVSMLNLLLQQGAETGANEVYTDPIEILKQWTPWGIINNIIHSQDPRTRNMPIVNSVIHGYANVVNYWAACVPCVRDLCWLWILLVRRPKKTLAKYLDVRLRIQESTNQVRSTKGTHQMLDYFNELAEFDTEAKNPKDHFWRFEPHIMYSPAEPPISAYTGVNWHGHAFRVGFVIRGASGLMPPATYKTAVDQTLFPNEQCMETYTHAVNALPKIVIGYSVH